MITFGYKSKVSSILRAAAAIAIGLVMIISNEATVSVVKIIAAFLFASGVVSLIYGIIHKKEGALTLMATNAMIDMAIGMVLFFFPQFVTGVIVVIIGIVLVIFGLMQIVVLASSMALIGLGFFAFLLPVLAVIGGVLLLFNPFSIKVMCIIAGVCLTIYGVSELLSMFKVEKAKQEYEIRFPSANDPEGPNSSVNAGGATLDNVKEVDFKKEN